MKAHIAVLGGDGIGPEVVAEGLRVLRAVARACATNPVSVLTPCHRVVGADGTLRGYRWGLDRKRRLLEQEQTQTPRSAAPRG